MMKTLETERLVLRKYVPDDAQAMFDNRASDSEVARYVTWHAHASVKVSEEYVSYIISKYEKPDTFQWCIVWKETNTPIGDISVVDITDGCYELGRCLSRKYRGQGIMPEAARAVVDYLFNVIGVETVCAKHIAANAKSGRVMQKIGMKHMYLEKYGMKVKGKIVDIEVYEIRRGKK